MKISNVFRFSIATLLLIIAIVGGFIAGFQAGYKKGEEKWTAMPLTVRVYIIDTHHINGNADKRLDDFPNSIDELASVVNDDLIPKHWVSSTGKVAFADHRTHVLIVNGNNRIHEQVACYLKHLQAEYESRTKGDPKQPASKKSHDEMLRMIKKQFLNTGDEENLDFGSPGSFNED